MSSRNTRGAITAGRRGVEQLPPRLWGCSQSSAIASIFAFRARMKPFSSNLATSRFLRALTPGHKIDNGCGLRWSNRLTAISPG